MECLGIDTSNYKTSVAITDDSGNIIFNCSEFLDIKAGERGLRQSEAFYQQANKLPSMLEKALSYSGNLDVISVSDAPRRAAGSYMPVFLAGINAARIISSSLNIPIFYFSHQEGHISSALHSIPKLRIKEDKPFIFLHLSGGTTEFLLCERNDFHFETSIIGGTKDISVGQLLDRIGVKMGYSFPAGKYIDSIAQKESQKNLCDELHTHDTFIKPSKIKLCDGFFNLSGIETQMLKLVELDEIQKHIPALFDRIAEMIVDNIKYLSDKYSTNTVIISGGVAASQTLKEIFFDKKTVIEHLNVQFADQEFAGDNAVGIALLGGEAYSWNR